MKIQEKLHGSLITITEPMIADKYFIEQAEDGLFHITSSNGYSSYEGRGYNSLSKAIAEVRKMIKNYFLDRGEANPKGW